MKRMTGECRLTTKHRGRLSHADGHVTAGTHPRAFHHRGGAPSPRRRNSATTQSRLVLRHAPSTANGRANTFFPVTPPRRMTTLQPYITSTFPLNASPVVVVNPRHPSTPPAPSLNMAEVTFAKQFLATLDARPVKLPSDHVADARKLSPQAAVPSPIPLPSSLTYSQSLTVHPPPPLQTTPKTRSYLPIHHHARPYIHLHNLSLHHLLNRIPNTNPHPPPPHPNYPATHPSQPRRRPHVHIRHQGPLRRPYRLHPRQDQDSARQEARAGQQDAGRGCRCCGERGGGAGRHVCWGADRGADGGY